MSNEGTRDRGKGRTVAILWMELAYIFLPPRARFLLGSLPHSDMCVGRESINLSRRRRVNLIPGIPSLGLTLAGGGDDDSSRKGEEERGENTILMA